MLGEHIFTSALSQVIKFDLDKYEENNMEHIFTSALSKVIGKFRSYAGSAADKQAGITVKGIKYPAVMPKPMPVFKVGEYVKFGSYPQNYRSGEPIEWLVLEVSDQEALLVSHYGLDCKEYHHWDVPMTWEQCNLRRWLNGKFLKAAFSAEDQRRIKLSEVVNGDNREYGTRGGYYTQDRVFCLSLAEAERYFKNDSERLCRPTAHARNQGAGVDNGNGCCCWWLRSPGFNQECASWVNAGGALCPGGNAVWDIHAVRPALRLIWNR